MRSIIATILSLVTSSALAQPYWGNYPDGATLPFWTNTIGSDGAPATPASETVGCIKDGTGADIGGVTINDDAFVAGQHLISVDTTDSDYTTGSLYTIYYTAGTVDSVSIAGRVIGSFYLGPKDANVTQFGGANGSFSAGRPDVNATQFSGSSTAADNAEVVFATDFAANYNTTADKWNSSLTHANGSALGSTGAANFRAFFDGNGYGNVICSTTVAGSPTSSDTVMMLQTPRPENDGGLVGCIAVLRSASAGEDFGPAVSVHRIVSYNYDAAVGTITIDSSPSFDLAAGDQVTILEPTFLPADRTNLAAILADTGTDGVVLANNAITHEKIAADAIGASEIADGAIDAGALAANAITAAKIAADVTTELQTGLPLLAYFEALFDGAPTFGEAMDEQGYTMALASKLDTNVDAKISEVPVKMPSVLVSTTIDDATPTQTSFELAAGPPDDDALNGAIVIITRGTQKSVGLVKDYEYEEPTKTITLVTDPGIFTFADGDQVDVIATGAAVPLWLGAQ